MSDETCGRFVSLGDGPWSPCGLPADHAGSCTVDDDKIATYEALVAANRRIDDLATMLAAQDARIGDLRRSVRRLEGLDDDE
jgi:hypothetical protein